MKVKQKTDKKPALTPENKAIGAIVSIMHTGQFAAMEYSAKRFHKLFPQNGKIAHLVGVALLSQQRNIEVEPWLEKALALSPDDAEVWDHLAIALNRTGRKLEAEHAYAQSLTLDPHRPDTWANSAKNAHELEHYSHGEARSRNALQMAPDHLGGLSNLGSCLVGLRRYTEALIPLQRADSLRPNDYNTLLSLGAAMLGEAFERRDDAGMLQAKIVFERALAMEPQSVKSFEGMAGTCIKLGQLEENLHWNRKVLQTHKSERNIHSPAPQKGPFSVAQARIALLRFKALMETAGYPFFLMAGTALGIHRGGDILPFDKDLDVGMFWDIPRAALHTLLAENRYQLVPTLPGDDPEQNWNTGMVDLDTGISIDVFFHKDVNGGHIFSVPQRPINMEFSFPHITLESLSWQEQTWQIPMNCAAYLETMYGKDWKIPDPGFDTLLSGFNKNPESLHSSLAFGYARLCDNVEKHNYPKALAYCRQILALQDDPIVREWAEWLITTDQCRAIAAQGRAL